MRTAILKRLNALEASLNRKTRKPMALIDVTEFDPDDRDAHLGGDDTVLTRYGFEPSPLHIAAVVISVHPDRRDECDDIADLDDEELERVDQRRERGDRRRQTEEAEQRQLEAIQATREELPAAPGNAYSPVYDRD